MARPKKADKQELTQALAVKPQFQRFAVWLVGDTPLISHAWSEKGKRNLLASQVDAPGGKEARNPQEDFLGSLYEMSEGVYGFPAMAFKKAILSSAHKDKGIPRSVVQSALWIEAQMVRVRPALAGAICDMPLLRLWGSAPEMREDMVRVGSGLHKTATFAYRAQFTNWAVKLAGRFNASVLNATQISFLIQDGGLAQGVGDWRNEKSGVFGAFHLADAEEEAAWDAFAAGTGMLPISAAYQQAA